MYMPVLRYPLFPPSWRLGPWRIATALMLAMLVRPVATLPIALGGDATVLAQGRPPAPTPRVLSRHIAQRYTTADGLPGNYVWGMSQGRDGTLWLIAGGVLTRFDGERFEEVEFPTTVDDPTRGEHPVAIEAQGDTLWVATEDNRVLRRVGANWTLAYRSPRTFGELAVRAGYPLFARNVNDLTATVWRGTTLLRRYTTFGDGDARLLPQLVIDSDGVPWAADGDRGRRISLAQVPGVAARGAPSPATIPDTIPLATGAFVQAPGSLAPLGVRRVQGLLQVVDRTGRVLRSLPDGDGRMPRLLTRDRRLVVTSRRALEIHSPDGGPPDRIDGDFVVGGDGVVIILEDAEGAVWVATKSRGLLVVRPRTIRQVVPSAGALTQVRNISRMRDGTALLVADGLYRVPSPFLTGAPITMPRPTRLALDGMPAVRTWAAAAEDHRGAFWVSYVDSLSRGVLAVQRTGESAFTLHRDRLALQLLEDRATNAMLVLERERLSVFALDAPARPPRAVIPLAGWDARFLLLGPDATAYVAGQRGLLVLPPAVWRTGATLQGRGVREYTPETGYPLRALRTLHLDTEGALWIGMYGRGLARLHRDSLRLLQRRDGLAENIVSTILEDETGTFWLGGNRGVHTLTRAERVAWLSGERARVAGVLFDQRAGLDNPEGSGWFGTRTPDGTLWLPTFGGAVVVPATASRDVLPRHGAVTIERVSINDSLLPVRDTVTLPLGARQLTIRVTGVSLRAPATNPIEFRLVGPGRDATETPWRGVADDRSIRLAGLGPGRWMLELRGQPHDSRADVTVGPTTAAMTIVVPPFFRETGTFLALLAVVFGILLLAGVQLRTRVLSARAEALREEVNEQTHWLLVEQERTAVALERAVETEGRLRELLSAKARAFASLSHELRTPMSLVLSPLAEVERDAVATMPDSARRNLATLRAAVDRLARLTRQFLDLADSQSGTVRLRRAPADVALFVKHCVEAIVPIAERRGVRLAMAIPVGNVLVAAIDPDHMDKVVTNLLANAIRHTPTGAEVRVRVGAVDIDGIPMVQLAVADEGPGIAPELLERIFDPFFQGPGATEGMGLGLSLSRDVVILHGGTIDVESRPQGGATFTVTIPRDELVRESAMATPPLSPAVPAASGGVPTEVQSGAGRGAAPVPSATTPGRSAASVPRGRILLVEDDLALRDYLAGQLGQHHTVMTAGNGDEALPMVRSWQPELVISDIMMSGLDGLALCRILKADAATRNIPVLLLTAKGTNEDQERGLRAGADQYVTKPFDLQQLLLVVANALRLRRSIEERFDGALPAWAAIMQRNGIANLDRESERLLERLYSLLLRELANPDLDVDTLARELFISRSSLYRRVRELFNCSPLDLLGEVRLEQAAVLLRTTDERVSTISTRVGFRAPAHFTRRFVGHFGMSPAVYRSRTRSDLPEG